ncbi:MAG: hypothetical protein A2V66_05455 [Ignavibacteria bacterium RBG_13_36_8]|nr:MAG: hypothetical protein A2V66_05455 [Ignavibacteria bacterium RBG_13_36_8]
MLFPILSYVFPQQKPATGSDILLALKKLNVLGSVLYIGAHPDDENTSLLSYMSKGQLMRTAYLSITRGDGGQNLLGNELGDLLGVIRTQELLAARNIDGAEQFFTRAIDFGYSKTPEESLSKWNNEIVLSDIVKIIRQFQPDIIISRFSKTEGGHGHHLASAILAEEAFYAAADPNRFPEQLNEVKPWQVKRLLWNTWKPNDKSISIDVGTYDPLIGQSFLEMAADSRSMHKSQGFGMPHRRGSRLDYYDYFAGDSVASGLFDDIDVSWNKIPGGNKIQSLVNKAIENFADEHPENIVSELVEIYKQLELLDDNHWVSIKKNDVKELIKMCSGLWIEAIAAEPNASQNMNIEIESMILNRSNIPVSFEKIFTTYMQVDSIINYSLVGNKPFSLKQTIHIPNDAEYSQPYWLKEPHDENMFSVSNPEYIGASENKPALVSKFDLKILGVPLQYTIPIIYRWTDAVKGELTRPFTIQPELSLKIDNPTYVFPDGKTHEVNVYIEAKVKYLEGSLFLSLPAGWKAQPEKIPFQLAGASSKASFTFQVTPGGEAKDGEMVLHAEANGKTFADQIIEIDYPHIPIQTVLETAKAKIIKLDINIEPRRIGYIMGAGDDIPQSLIQLGYNVDLLSDEDLDNGDLSIYDVIICGVRAFNSREGLTEQQDRLNKFVANGGTWIAQHNTRFGNQTTQIGPYKFDATGRDRVAEEEAPINILLPDHPVFNYPNKITQEDFKDWIQERGLYFADTWDENLTPLLSSNDIGETEKLGGLLYSTYGKGVFIYTGYSWFRQLPAGVPGAYRLFVNLISARKESESKTAH